MTKNITTLTAVLCLILDPCIRGQEHSTAQNACETLRNAGMFDLVQFLNKAAPNEENSGCIIWAIRKVGAEQYEGGIPAVARLLDFRRPPTPTEKAGYTLHPQGIDDLYPAAEALSLFSENGLPAVLAVIKSDSASTVARQNAVFVWMEIHRFRDEHPKGVALLNQEEVKAKDDATKERLKWAVSKAITWCNPPEESACKRAAALGNPESTSIRRS